MEAIGEDASLRLDQTRTVEAVRNGYSFFQDGDVAFAKVTPCFENGKAAVMSGLNEGVGFGTTELTIARAMPRIHNRFLFYVLTEDRFRQLGKSAMTGAGGLKRVPDLFTKDYSFPLPSLYEQCQVVDFLDGETAQIDDLIRKQGRLIELLAEKRQAIITHAVTAPGGGGLPSKIRYHASLNPSVPAALKAQQDAMRTFLPMNTIGERGEIDKSLTRPVGEVLGGYSYFQDGDVCFAKVTPCFENGKGAVFHDLSSGEGFGTTELTVLRCRSELSPDYLYLLTQSDLFRKNGVAAMTGAGGLKRVPDEFVRNFEFILPSSSRQSSIVTAVKGHVEAIDLLGKRAQRAVMLLAERRMALISAAVTGKIDVRKEAS